MCGIFGGSGKLEKNILISLGCQSESRGTDSSGLAWIDKLKRSILVSKVTERGTVAFPVLLDKDIKQASKSNAMIGHTRMASTGKVNTKNAHPFFIDNIVFAHNGVISNYEKFGNHDCDSVCLLDGIKERNFEKFIGSIALVWIENGKLQAYRKGNPIFRGKRGSALYLASEKSMLARVKCKKIKELTEGMIYTFDNGQIVETVKVKENNQFYYIGSQLKFSQKYDLTDDCSYWNNWPENQMTKQEKKELNESGLGFFNRDGKRYYGKLDQEYEDAMNNLDAVDEKDIELSKEKSKNPIIKLEDSKTVNFGKNTKEPLTLNWLKPDNRSKRIHSMSDKEFSDFGGV